MYKCLFMLSIFLIISLCSIYIYAEYDRNKDENNGSFEIKNIYNLSEEDIDVLKQINKELREKNQSQDIEIGNR